VLKSIIKSYTQIRQWKTKRKIVVFESDDWGSIRMPDIETYKYLSEKYPDISNDNYSKYDTLAKIEDFESLFNVLSKYSDSKGNKPILTANAIMANPDFRKIRESDFEEYFYEPFYKTIEALPDGKNILELWNYGIRNKLLQPQLHGREHLLVSVWMKELKQGNKELITAFEKGVYSVPCRSNAYAKRKNLQAAFDYSSIPNEEQFHKNAILESAEIFKNYFGFVSKSFIASSYIWNHKIESVLFDTGVKYIQGLSLQYEPKVGVNQYYKRLHYTGQTNKHGQIYLVRNAFFEPSYNPGIDWVSDCMHRIEKAFMNHTPLILSVHRVNFIGSLNASNRLRNLKLFDELLSSLTQKWPDVEFMSSDQLGDLIHAEKHRVK
jgi:hypothetical protein